MPRLSTLVRGKIDELTEEVIEELKKKDSRIILPIKVKDESESYARECKDCENGLRIRRFKIKVRNKDGKTYKLRRGASGGIEYCPRCGIYSVDCLGIKKGEEEIHNPYVPID